MAEYIEKTAVLEALQSEGITRNMRAFRKVQELPAARVEPVRRGRWDGEGYGDAETEGGEMALVIDVWYCSECGHCIDEGIDEESLLPNFCPNCGAKMDKGA